MPVRLTIHGYMKMLIGRVDAIRDARFEDAHDMADAIDQAGELCDEIAQQYPSLELLRPQPAAVTEVIEIHSRGRGVSMPVPMHDLTFEAAIDDVTDRWKVTAHNERAIGFLKAAGIVDHGFGAVLIEKTYGLYVMDNARDNGFSCLVVVNPIVSEL